MKFGSITTPIVTDGLVFNVDPANRASYVDGDTETLNTINSAQSGSISGATFVDTSGPTWNFDGTDDIIICNLGDTLAGSPYLTIGIWMNLGSYSSKGYFGMKGATNQLFEANAYGNQLRWKVINSAQGGSSLSYGYISNFQNTVPLGEWFYYTGVFDGTLTGNDRAKLYINGTQVSLTYSGTFPNILSLNYTSATKFYMGRSADTVFGNVWRTQGNISNTHLYNRALSSTEILHNYNALKSRFGL